jgi:hypothetical protein
MLLRPTPWPTPAAIMDGADSSICVSAITKRSFWTRQLFVSFSSELSMAGSEPQIMPVQLFWDEKFFRVAEIKLIYLHPTFRASTIPAFTRESTARLHRQKVILNRCIVFHTLLDFVRSARKALRSKARSGYSHRCFQTSTIRKHRSPVKTRNSNDLPSSASYLLLVIRDCYDSCDQPKSKRQLHKV